MAGQTSNDNDMIIFEYHHLLPVTLPKEYSNKFLGRLVPNRRHPKANYIPDWDVNEEEALTPQKLVPGLSDKPMPYGHLNALLSSATSHKAEARITELLGLRASNNTTTSTKIDAIHVERYEMGLIQQKIDKLMEQEQYSEPVVSYLKNQPDRSCAMVTGIVICKKLIVKHESKEQRGLDIDLNVPLGAAASALGAPPIKQLDIDLEYDHTGKKKGKEGSTTCEEAVIALAYTQVQLQEALEESSVPAVKHNGGLHGLLNRITHKTPATTTEIVQKRYNLKAINLDASNAYMGRVENENDVATDKDKDESKGGVEEEVVPTREMDNETPTDLEEVN